jgi:hypothetical protein
MSRKLVAKLTLSCQMISGLVSTSAFFGPVHCLEAGFSVPSVCAIWVTSMKKRSETGAV